MRDARHCDLSLLHGFQKGGLHFVRGAVDLVAENNIGKDRTGIELDLAALFGLVVTFRPGHI